MAPFTHRCRLRPQGLITAKDDAQGCLEVFPLEYEIGSRSGGLNPAHIINNQARFFELVLNLFGQDDLVLIAVSKTPGEFLFGGKFKHIGIVASV